MYHSFPQVVCALEFVTPEMAKKYLEKNIPNRPFSAAHAASLSRDIKAGKWQLTHQGIAFDENGFLIDGQHRLNAIILAGVGIYMFVTRQLSAGAKLNVDNHKARKPSHSLSIARGTRITDDRIAIIKAAIAYCNNSAYDKRITNIELDALYDQFTNAFEWIDATFPVWREKGVTSATVKCAVALAWFYVKDLSRLQEFVDIMCGKKLPENSGDSAALKFRELMLKEAIKNEADRRAAFKKAQRAIHTFFLRRSVQRISTGGIVYRWPLDGAVRS